MDNTEYLPNAKEIALKLFNYLKNEGSTEVVEIVSRPRTGGNAVRFDLTSDPKIVGVLKELLMGQTYTTFLWGNDILDEYENLHTYSHSRDLFIELFELLMDSYDDGIVFLKLKNGIAAIHNEFVVTVIPTGEYVYQNSTLPQ